MQLHGRPEKLGDGTFGAVYKIYDLSAKPVAYALKILYERQFNTALTTKPGRSGANTSSVDSTSSVGTPDSLAEFRFEYESQITDILREKFEDLGIEGDVVTDYVAHAGIHPTFTAARPVLRSESFTNSRAETSIYPVTRS